MTRRKSSTDLAQVVECAKLVPIPTPPIPLHDLGAVRLEMARVYRDMRSGKIDSQVGTRLVYVLGQIAKVHEIAVLEKKVAELEKLAP